MVMLQPVDLASVSLESYEPEVGASAIAELRELAAPLRGASVAHINATSYGGGVSELLRSEVPLYRALGIDAHWFVIPGDQEFFEVTKGFHNALQGASFDLSAEAREIYLRQNQEIALFMDEEFDYTFVHDPQPAAVRGLLGDSPGKWIWRCHIDTSAPNREVANFLAPFIREHDALVYTMDQFIPESLRDMRLVTIAPGIDPLSPKNLTLPTALSSRIAAWTGVDPTRPTITQISRFDPWKDPIGVIEVYRLVREQVPGIQLALLGQMALDDPEGWEMYRRVVSEAGSDPNIHVRTNLVGIGNIEVNAFQAHSNVVLQKSIREGFGLVVSEALWKGTPVVAGRAGGIPMQMPEGHGRNLVDSNEECAARIVELLNDPMEAQRLGTTGRSHVKENFLVTRMIAEELRLLNSL
jgi:trehalose synthase